MAYKIDGNKLILDSIDHYYSTLSFAMESYLYQYLCSSFALPHFANFQALAIGGLLCSFPFAFIQHYFNHQLRQEHISNYKILAINHSKFFITILELMSLSLAGGAVLSLNMTALFQLNVLTFCIHTAIRISLDFLSQSVHAHQKFSHSEFFKKIMFDQHIKLNTIQQQSLKLFERLFKQDWFNLVLFLLRNAIQITLFLTLGLFVIDIDCNIYSALGYGFMNALINSFIFFQTNYIFSVMLDDSNKNLINVLTHLSNLFLLFSCVGMFGQSYSLAINIAMVVGNFVYTQLNNVYNLISHLCQKALGEEVPHDYMPKFY
jgi:hypothetical protein